MKTRLDFATVLALGIVLSLFSACVLVARGYETDDKATNDKATNDKATNDKATNDKATNDKATNDKATNDKATNDKATAENPPSESKADTGKSKNVLADLEKAKDRVAPTYRLGYRFQPGEVVRTRVVHLATVETKIKGVSQNTKSRTVSTRAWQIREVDQAGNITFDNTVERVEMWNSVEGRQEVHFDSATDKTPPPEFTSVAASVGKVLATIKIDPQGRIVSRTNNQAQYNPGIGDLTVPFPPADSQPVKVGATWSIGDELKMPLEDGTIKKVKTQQQYKLEKIEAGVATIAVATTVLTPVNDPKLKSQLVQRLQKGTIKFDVDAGRLIHKQLDIDQEVIGFSGAESIMQYLARFTEEPLKDELASRNK